MVATEDGAAAGPLGVLARTQERQHVTVRRVELAQLARRKRSAHAPRRPATRPGPMTIVFLSVQIPLTPRDQQWQQDCVHSLSPSVSLHPCLPPLSLPSLCLSALPLSPSVFLPLSLHLFCCFFFNKETKTSCSKFLDKPTLPCGQRSVLAHIYPQTCVTEQDK